MRESFPNAIITSEYGSTDVEATPIGTPCHPMDDSDPLEVFHTSDRFYLEIVDPTSGTLLPLEAGVEGDLVISAQASAQAAFPLIRYRHGDSIRVVESACKEHGEWSFQVLGRRDADFLKITGGLLRADEIIRVLRQFNDSVTDTFELHCYDDMKEGSPIIRTTLRIQSKGEHDMKKLAEAISKNLHVAPTYTYAQGVTDGHYLPMKCEPLGELPLGKHRRMIRHSE